MVVVQTSWVTRWISMLYKQTGDMQGKADPTIGMSMGIHGIIAGATEFMHC